MEVRLKRQRKWMGWLCGILAASWLVLGGAIFLLLQEEPPEPVEEPVAPRSSTMITDKD